jgi:hypothetical protein
MTTNARVIALIGCFTLTAATAWARPATLDLRIQGTFTGTSVDVNSNGQPGAAVAGTAVGPGGSRTLSGYAEPEFTGFNTANCPNQVENTFASYPVVLSDARGDQIWGVLTAGHLCFDPGSGSISTIVTDQNVIGGTGAYSGATGTIHTEATGQALAVEPARLAFGTFSGAATLTLGQ